MSVLLAKSLLSFAFSLCIFLWLPQHSPVSAISHSGAFLRISRRMGQVCTLGLVLGLVGSGQNGMFVQAQRQGGGKNKTLEPMNARILYEPVYPLFMPVDTSLGMKFMRAFDDGGGLPGVRRASLTILRGSALYYISPLFPYDARVHFQLLLTSSASSVSNRSEAADQLPGYTLLFDHTLLLLDNTTERVTDRDRIDSTGPTRTYTFKISENLNVNEQYTAIVASDFEDATTWTWIGYFVITSHDPKPNLRVILPVSILSSFIIILALIGSFPWYRKRAKRRSGLPAAYPPSTQQRSGGSDRKVESRPVIPRGGERTAGGPITTGNGIGFPEVTGFVRMEDGQPEDQRGMHEREKYSTAGAQGTSKDGTQGSSDKWDLAQPGTFPRLHVELPGAVVKPSDPGRD